MSDGDYATVSGMLARGRAIEHSKYSSEKTSADINLIWDRAIAALDRLCLIQENAALEAEVERLRNELAGEDL